MKKESSSFFAFLRALPLEVLLTVVFFMLPLLGVNAGNVNAYGWFPVIFVLVFSANHLRAKGWWGCCLYALAFLLWIPAVFLHYEAFNLEWTLLVANLMALVVFLSVGKRMGTREWASRALHRLVALFQACVVGLIYLLALKGVVWCVYTLWLGRPEFYLEREYPQLLLFFTMVMYLIIGLVLCWRLCVQSIDEGRK